MKTAFPDEPRGRFPDIPAPRDGMTSDQLADVVDSFITQAQARVTGTGRSQYDRASHQRFERLSPSELLAEIKAEVIDIANYSVMFYILILRLEKALARVRAAKESNTD